MIQSDEDNSDSSEETASISYNSTSSASSRAHPRVSLFLENLEGANGDPNAEGMEMTTVSYESTSRGQGFAVYINNERYSQIMGASTSSSSTGDSSSITQFHDTQDNNIPTNTVGSASLRRYNVESSLSTNVTPSPTVAVRPERALNSPSSQRLSWALTISTSVLMGEDTEGSPLEQEHSRVVSSLYSSLAIRGNDEPKNKTPPRPISSIQPQEMTEHSLFSYDYDDTLEPNVEEAVKLTKNKKTGVNYIRSIPDEDSDVEDSDVEDSDVEDQDNYETVGESRFVPHILKIPEKAASIKSSTSDESPAVEAPSTSTKMMKVPQSPSLIGNILIPSHNSDGSNEDSFRDHIETTNEDVLHSSSTRKLSSSLDEEGPPIGVPSIPVLKSVSGSSKWGRKSLLKKLESSGKSEPFSPYRGPKTPSPLTRVDESKDKKASKRDLSIVLAPIKSQCSGLLAEDNPTIKKPAQSIRRSRKKDIDTGRKDGDNVVNIDLEARMPIQHIDTASIHSFDSEHNGFKDVYSIESIAVVILCCIVVPPLFFIIGCGTRNKMVSDYRLMKLLMNKEHRAALLQGFVWDADLRWFRILCLILGAAEAMIVFAGIAIGFGVGITRE
ncbi:bud8p [Saccharomyces arboricola H-6]|uniref:Bud8p n=1 Tax=Saccharomyces arboricola (strain H-6 / AS 2.3317 / CBS 10644) TaxID=1160507 RepID=J8Q1R9_SACAR|nr:bud8p [Saccharomyces arboricola H-6]